MRRILFAVLLVVTTTYAASSAILEKYYQEASITIQKSGPFDDDKIFKIRIGDKVRFTIKVYQTTFFDYPIINANANIDNTTGQKIKAIYNISFHDEDDKLVGCHQGSWELAPNQNINYGSAIIHARKADIAKVTLYRLKNEVITSRKK